MSKGFVDELTNDPRGPVAPTTLLSYVADRPLDFPPGTQYHYSDSDNIVVGLMIEQATRPTYEQALSSLVTDPLGLGNTSMATGWTLPTPFVHGYAEGDEDASQVLNASVAWASGGMISTPPALARFVRAYASGKLITGATRAAQFDSSPAARGRRGQAPTPPASASSATRPAAGPCMATRATSPATRRSSARRPTAAVRPPSRSPARSPPSSRSGASCRCAGPSPWPPAPRSRARRSSRSRGRPRCGRRARAGARARPPAPPRPTAR